MKCRIFSFIVYLLVLCTFFGCSAIQKKPQVVDDERAKDNIQVNTEVSAELKEDRSVYKNDKSDSVIHLYVTVLKENNISNGKIVTLSDLNSFNYRTQSESPKVEVIFQEGTPDGPEIGHFGYGTKTANASMEVRGHSSSVSPQKSFKIKLYDKAGLWNDQRTLNLNKHPRDFIKVRNKLSFDYFKLIPNITSLRTQFVNLHVKDLSDSTNNNKFIDYGLFTHVEQPNKMFLKSHGLDPNAHLYKAEYFEFQRYPDLLKHTEEPGYKKDEFEKILSIEGNEDHRKLIRMLDDVNNYNLDINTVVENHFNRNNMLTWLAANILMENYDTNSQNFILYSPLNSNTWYFLPWDYDGAWGQYKQIGGSNRIIPDWQVGLSNYWGMVLFNRFFKDTNNVKALNDKIESLTEIINSEKTKELSDLYHDIAFKYIRSYPDINYLPSMVENFEAEYSRVSGEAERNRNNYYKNIEKPMPFFLSEPVADSNKIKFEWEWSFDIQGDSINYEFQLSTDPGFSNIVAKKEKILDNKCILEQQLEGIYYWRVTAYDDKGNSQKAFDEYIDTQGNRYFGAKQFIAKKQ